MNTHVLDPFILSLVTFVPLGGALLLMAFPRRERDIRAFTLAVACAGPMRSRISSDVSVVIFGGS